MIPFTNDYAVIDCLGNTRKSPKRNRKILWKESSKTSRWGITVQVHESFDVDIKASVVARYDGSPLQIKSEPADLEEDSTSDVAVPPMPPLKMAPDVLLKEEEDLGARFGVDNSIVPIEVDQVRVHKLIICFNT